jgi:hypothetical protein
LGIELEIWHRVSFNVGAQPRFRKAVDRLGIQYKVSPLPGGSKGIGHIDITESDRNWSRIQRLVKKHVVVDICDTIFSDEEILNAAWCRLVPVYEQGYPEPQESWNRHKETYERHCLRCGVHAKQISPFSIAKEPTPGPNSFLSLYWTYALFAVPSVFECLEYHGVRGYDAWDVLLHKTGDPSQTIAQIVVADYPRASLVPEADHRSEACTDCGVLKYRPHMRGTMRLGSDLSRSDSDFLLSDEWFGSGGAAYREIIVSHRVSSLIVTNKWSGVRLKPIDSP